MLEMYLKTNGITIVSLIYLILIFILYYLKGTNNRVTSKIFKVILYVTFIIMIMYSLWSYYAINGSKLQFVIGRITLLSVICWDFLLAFYVSFLFGNDDKNLEILKKHKIKFIILGSILFILHLILCFVLEFDSYQVVLNGSYYMGGFLNTYVQILATITFIYSVIVAFINYKKVDKMTSILFLFLFLFVVLKFYLIF